MKKVFLISLCLLWAGAVGAAELSVDFTFSTDDVVLTPAGEYTSIDLANGSRQVDEVGAPSIPAKFVNILLPAGAENVKISARGDGALLAQDIVPRPAQPRRPKSKPRLAFVSANARYAGAEAWPAEVATYQGDHDMQGYRFVSVRVNPLAYVGAEKALYLRKQVTVTVRYDIGASLRAISSKQKNTFEPLVNSLVVNPSDASAFAPAVKTVAPKAALDYLIITSSALSNAFQQIANYRSSAAGGSYSTRVVTTNAIGALYSGDIQARIRTYISNSVVTLGTTMVLLGGDDTVVLDRNCYAAVPDQSTTETNMPTDLYYSGCLTGTWNGDGDAKYGETNDGVDMGWDVVVARLPMRTAAQVTNYLNKVMAYESGSPVTNKIILGGPYAWDTYTGTDRPSDDVTVDGHAGFRSTSPAHTSVSDSEAWLRRLYRDGIRSNWPATVGIMCDTLTSWDGTTCGDHLQSSANTIAAFNQNWTHLMFSGHGEPQAWGLESGNFTQTNADGLTGLTAFVYTDACLTGAFDGQPTITVDVGTADEWTYTTEPCLAEGFLRNTRVLGGALAYMGCARYGWGDPDAAPASNTARGGPSTEYAYKFYKRMYETSGRTLGVAFAMHKADMISYSSTDDCERWIQFGMNLLGDPALKMPVGISAPTFAANPGPLTATTGVATTFTVVASGSPTPVLALQSQTASSGYGFVPATGVLTYAPPAADIGSRTFTFRATNTQGAATQTVSVTVVEPLPAAPASIWASATNTTDFTAAWSPVSGATGYRLDVGTNATFSGGGASVQSVLASNAATSPSTLTNDWSGFALGGTTYIQMTNTGAVITSAAFSTVGATNLTVEFKARTYGGGTKSNITVSISSDNGVNWTVMGVVYPLSTSLVPLPTLTNTANLGNSQTRIRWQAPDAGAGVGVGVVTLVVKGWSGGGTPSFAPGYSNRTVAGTSQSVTGLTAGATYYFRARAVNTAGAGANSSVANVTTKTSGVIPPPQPISIVIPPTNGAAMTMQIQSVSGVTYALEYTVDLVPPLWIPIASTNGTTGAAVTLQDTNSAGFKRFYRIVMP